MTEKLKYYFKLEMLNSKQCIAVTDYLMKSLFSLTPLPENDKYHLRVALSEIVSNSYLHGNNQESNKKIFVTCSIFNDRIEITVEDEGEGFKIDEVEEKYATSGIYASGGRGLKIIDKFTDSIIYRKMPDGKFAVVVTKRYPKSKKVLSNII
jgi:anti-sigma regulatory factor (Ser/Thr protein kinase)